MTELTTTRRRWAALVALVCLVTAGWFGSSPSSAAESLVQVKFTAVDAPVTGDGTVTVAGTVTNTSDRKLRRVQVLLWRYRSVVATNPDELSTVLASTPDNPIGARISNYEPAFQDITSDAHPVFAPGEQATFRVTVPLSQLDLDADRGVYLIGVHVRSQADDGSLTTIARARTLLSRPPASNHPVATITSVVMLTSPPSTMATGVFVDDHLASELTPEGRLSQLLTSAQRPGVSYAIDPSLLAEISDMADGYQVLSDHGEPVNGTGAAAAKNWLTRFQSLDGDGWLLPSAMADINAISADGRNTTLMNLLQRSTALTDLDLPVLVTSNSGQLSAEAIELSQHLHPSAILASNLDSTVTVGKPHTGTAPVVRLERDVFEGGPQPDSTIDDIRIRDRRDAQTLVTAMSGRKQQVRLITSGREAQLDSHDPQWVSRQSLAELLARQPEDWSGSVTPVDANKHISSDTVHDVLTTADLCAALVDLVVAPGEIQARSDLTLSRALSEWFAGNTAQSADVVDSLDPLIAPLREGNAVTMAVAPKVTLTAREGTYFPATITNRLKEPIRVQPVFQSEQPQRLNFPPQDPVEIGPGQSVTVDIQPKTQVNGTVVSTGRLRTVSGHPVSEPVQVMVESTNLGQAGGVIVVVSGLVLLGTTTWRIRQVRARTARKQVLDEQ